MAATNRLDRYPVDEQGNLEHYPSRIHTWGKVERDLGQLWSEGNEPFAATLSLVSGNRGRSAAYFVWRDEAGRTYPMFMTDLVDVLMCKLVDRGAVSGLWQVRKRGQNYGLALATAPRDHDA
ncbi:hypothetical protein CS0771_46050 [Catellatospora sp. IY07-71]|uniref:hypothetical protein n=1 Tax=Catellatospora sp. IY07-71 TaxID=2728827 RepID=UPI001BB3E05F|nr:hypothetical protein [Catellatospora sp. IY07-71]BCJ75061.1 hypothetical protein CS0771_46050 [Catellatospora sp. IY07-71]